MEETIVRVLLAAVVLLAAGLRLSGCRKDSAMTDRQKTMLWRILAAALLLLALRAAGPFLAETFPAAWTWLCPACYLAAYLTIGHDILRKAGRGVVNRRVFDENLLMAVATLGALALALYGGGDYLEAVAVMLFYQIGEWFQGYAVGRSRRNIGALMDIRPDCAYVETEGTLERRAPESIPVGTVITVRPGDRVPIDGTVTEGRSLLNTAALTGESRLRPANPGDAVISGCVNMGGVLKIRTDRPFGESTVSKILELTENAAACRSRSEAFISRFARIYTPAVCGAALLLAAVPPAVNWIMGGAPEWSVWVYRALGFLVAGCPCALVISIPLSFFAGIGGACREGILIKGANCLETLAKTRTVAFDKTGTLTRGTFEVGGIHHSPYAPEKVLEYAALAESASTHPIARSLLSAYGRRPDCGRVSGMEELPGKGIRALVDGHPTAVGNAALMELLGLRAVPCRNVGTIVHVAIDGRYAGHIVVSDTVRPDAAEAIRALGRLGVRRVAMLTGDAPEAAAGVAAGLGIGCVRAGLLPADKVREVEALLADAADGEKVAFVGDGINDAPVLCRADVGIAMGALGSDAAIEAADVVLMDDSPLQVPKAIAIARRCLRIVFQNIVLAIGLKLLCLTLVALGLADMGLAVFADVGVMILAVLNAIRALRPPRSRFGAACPPAEPPSGARLTPVLRTR